MKYLNKFITVVLVGILLFNYSNIVHATNMVEITDTIQIYNVPIISNEYPYPTATFYRYGGKYYLSFEDIKYFTRSELDVSDSQIILIQGMREIYIEKDTGHMTDSGYVDQGNIDILEYKGKYLCEGIPMLTYLGAACSLKENEAIEVFMPITIWESIMPNYFEYCFNIEKMRGGKNNLNASLALDILADMLDGISGHGLFANVDAHIEDALLEILHVDIMKYDSVQKFVEEQNQKNQNLFSNNADIILSGGDLAKDAVEAAIEKYSEFYFNVQIGKDEFKWQRAYNAGDLVSASELSLQINRQVYNQSVAKVNIEKVNNVLDVGVIALNTAISTYNLLQYDDDIRNLFGRTITAEMFDYTDYHNVTWNKISDKISVTLSSDASIVASSATENIVDYITEEITEKGIEKVLSGFTSRANIYIYATKIGSYISSLLNYNLLQAYSADMNAIWLSVVQADVVQMTSRMLAKERNDYFFSDAESLEKLKDIFTLYYRTVIAFSENIAMSIDEFGGKDGKKLVQYFSATSDSSVSNNVAVYLYKITNCVIIPIVNYTELRDDLLNDDSISHISVPDVMLYINNYDELMSKLNMTLNKEINSFDISYLFCETDGFHFIYWPDENSLVIMCDDFADVSVNGVVCGIDLAEAKRRLSQNDWYDVTIDDEGNAESEYITFATFVDDTYYELILEYDLKSSQVKSWSLYNSCTDYIKGILAYNCVDEDWKKAYIKYIIENGMNYDWLLNSYFEIYKLVDIDGDNVPELYTNFGTTAGGDTICTYQGGNFNYQYIWNYGFSYIEGKNMFIDSGGHMDEYHDIVYTIDNSQFKIIFEGNYCVVNNSCAQWNENDLAYEYFVNNTSVDSEEEYFDQLKAIYDIENDITPFDNVEYDKNTGRYVGNGLCDYVEIIREIVNY